MNAEKTRQILEFLEELRRVGENFYGQPLFPRSVARTVTFLASTTPLDLSVTRWQQLREGLAFLVRHFSDGDTRSERAQRFNGPAALAALDRANEMMEAFFETSAIELAAVLSAARSSEPMEPQNDLFYQIRRFDYYMSEVQVLPQGLRKLAQEFARIDARSFDRPRFEMLIRDAAELQHEMEAFAATGASLSAQAPFSSFQRALGLVTSISGLLAAMLRGDYGPLDEAIVQSRSGPLREKAFAGLPVAPEPHRAAEGRNTIFIAHGRKQIYQSLVLHLEEEWDTDVEYFEHEDRTSDQITAVLDRMMEGAGAALIVMTAEDQTIDGTFRTRQNVVHEAGLFQGRLGFARVALLRPHHVEKFSNVDGLLYITLDEDHIEHSFTQIDRFLKKLSFARRQ